MNILGIIPARGGSKGIPKKNISKLNNKPLIYYSINSAIQSKKLNKIVVSTDDKSIATIAKKFGAEVPFIRSKKLATSQSKTLDVIKDTLNFLEKNEGYIPEIITILQPTSPLRSKKLIDESIHALIKNKATSVLSVKTIKTHPFGSFSIKNGFLKPFRTNFTKYHQRQTYPKLFYPTGGIYVFWNKTLQKYGNYYGPKIFPIEINNETNIDIDNKFDLFVAEMTLKHWKNIN